MSTSQVRAGAVVNKDSAVRVLTCAMSFDSLKCDSDVRYIVIMYNGKVRARLRIIKYSVVKNSIFIHLVSDRVYYICVKWLMKGFAVRILISNMSRFGFSVKVT